MSSMTRKIRRKFEDRAMKAQLSRTAHYQTKRHSTGIWSATVIGPFYGIDGYPTMYGTTVFVHRIGLPSATYRAMLKERLTDKLMAQFGYSGQLLHSAQDAADLIRPPIRIVSGLDYRPVNPARKCEVCGAILEASDQNCGYCEMQRRQSAKLHAMVEALR